MTDQLVRNQALLFDELLSRLQRAMYAQSVASSQGLTGSQIFILRYLGKREQSKASEIAKNAVLSPGAVTQVCDELVRLGYVERTRSNDDRRVVYVAITELGRNRLHEIRSARSDRMMDVVQELGAEDAHQFTELAARVLGIIEKKSGTKGEHC